MAIVRKCGEKAVTACCPAEYLSFFKYRQEGLSLVASQPNIYVYGGSKDYLKAALVARTW